MVRVQVSTTVDGELLQEARRLGDGGNDAALFDAALSALLNRHRAAQVEASYAAYESHPLAEADEWGDLASFCAATSSS